MRVNGRLPGFVCCLLLCAACCLHAAAGQSPAVTDATSFGRSVPLRGPWMAASGDTAGEDAISVEPAANDRGWKSLAQGRPLSEQGFSRVHSIWYRTRVRVRPDAPEMTLFVQGLDFNYGLYVNGRFVGGQGGTGRHDVPLAHEVATFRVPRELIAAGDGQLVVVLHVAGGPVGFLNMPPLRKETRIVLLNPEEVPLRQSYQWTHDWIEEFAVMSLDLLVGLCGLVIWISLREQREYLALMVWLLSNVMTILANFIAHLVVAGPVSGWNLLQVLMFAVSSVAELEFIRLLLKQRRSGVWLLLEVIAFGTGWIDPLLSLGVLPVAYGAAEAIVRPLITEVFVIVMLARGARRGNHDAPPLLLPVALWSFGDVYSFVRIVLWVELKRLLPELPRVHVFSYVVTFGGVADIVGLLSLVLIILLRTVRVTREKADLSAEVAAAEQLQMLLMARALRPTPGYQVDTIYRPMQEVGGDFFLVQPCEDDGSLVAIVGDVSGKGLQAAMRVSMILGVLQREVMGRPDGVLETLNKALVAQNDLGFTTACCVRIEADGRFCFANAGHLNPYVDGRELPSEGALPLGMDADARYPVETGRMLPRQRMVMMSDGVVEARARDGELFGFERTSELMRRSVAEIAEAAQRFGQEDDITVLALSVV